MKNIYLVACFILLKITCFSQINKSKILVTDLLKIKQASNIQISPDGKSAIFIVKTIEPNKENKLEFDYKTQLWITDFVESKQITFSNESTSQCKWSPDGKKISFVREVKGKSQIFILPINGGEASQLTDFKYGVQSPEWSPNGQFLLFSASVKLSELLVDSLLNPLKSIPKWSVEKPGLQNSSLVKNSLIKPNPDGNLQEIRAYLDQNVADKKAKVINRLNFQGEAGVEPDMSFSQVMTVNVNDGSKIDYVITGFNSAQNAKWAPNGTSIFYESGLDDIIHPDRQRNSAIFQIDLKSKKSTMIMGENGLSYNYNGATVDGKTVVLTYSKSEGIGFGNIALLNTTNKNVQKINFDRSAGNFKFSNDHKSLFFTAQANGGQPLYKLDLLTNKVLQITDFESGITNFDLNESKIVYFKTSVENPLELFVATTDMKQEKKISSLNSWVADRQISKMTKASFKNEKGLDVDYWIMKPTQFDVNKKYPLLLNMHGGPTAMWGPGEASMWHEFQYMAAQGYGIVFANPRGSGGYGLSFQQANFQDWGQGPASDVLTACSFAAQQNWVDTTRQVITGGSYAGYLTAWIVGHDHRFKAAFAQRGVYDLTTFMGEGNAWRLTPTYFGLPWVPKDFDVIKRESPYSYVDKIRTPLLIKHGENDLRTGVIQSEMLYKSMKYLGKDVEYVRMPGATHELSRTGNVRQRVDRLLRIYEFFERYVGMK